MTARSRYKVASSGLQGPSPDPELFGSPANWAYAASPVALRPRLTPGLPLSVPARPGIRGVSAGGFGGREPSGSRLGAELNLGSPTQPRNYRIVPALARRRRIQAPPASSRPPKSH